MPETLIHLLSQYGYVILFVSIFFMNAGVPIPGHTAYLAAAIMTGRGTLQLPFVMAVSVVAAIAGGFTGFYLGRRGGRGLVEVYGPKLGLSAARLGIMERFFERHGAKAVFFMRFIVVIRTFGPIFAGVSRVRPRLFAIVSIAGALAWAGLYGVAGFAFGDRWNVIEEWLGRGVFVILGILALAGLAHVLFTRRRRRG